MKLNLTRTYQFAMPQKELIAFLEEQVNIKHKEIFNFLLLQYKIRTSRNGRIINLDTPWSRSFIIQGQIYENGDKTIIRFKMMPPLWYYFLFLIIMLIVFLFLQLEYAYSIAIFLSLCCGVVITFIVLGCQKLYKELDKLFGIASKNFT